MIVLLILSTFTSPALAMDCPKNVFLNALQTLSREMNGDDNKLVKDLQQTLREAFTVVDENETPGLLTQPGLFLDKIESSYEVTNGTPSGLYSTGMRLNSYVYLGNFRFKLGSGLWVSDVSYRVGDSYHLMIMNHTGTKVVPGPWLDEFQKEVAKLKKKLTMLKQQSDELHMQAVARSLRGF